MNWNVVILGRGDQHIQHRGWQKNEIRWEIARIFREEANKLKAANWPFLSAVKTCFFFLVKIKLGEELVFFYSILTTFSFSNSLTSSYYILSQQAHTWPNLHCSMQVLCSSVLCHSWNIFSSSLHMTPMASSNLWWPWCFFLSFLSASFPQILPQKNMLKMSWVHIKYEPPYTILFETVCLNPKLVFTWRRNNEYH